MNKNKNKKINRNKTWSLYRLYQERPYLCGEFVTKRDAEAALLQIKKIHPNCEFQIRFNWKPIF